MALDRRAIVIAVLLGAFAVLPLAAELLDQTWYIGQFRKILIFAIAAVSLDLILGYGGMVCFGQAAFFGIGAYVVAILSWHAQRNIPVFGLFPGTKAIWITWPLAMLVAGSTAALIGLFSLRTAGIHFIMITLAFAQMIYFFFVSLRAYGGEDGLRFRSETTVFGLVDTRDEVGFYYVVYAILCLVLFLSWRLVRSRFGMVILGVRENERRMRALGFATFPYKLAAFTIAGAVSGLAGALFAVEESFISPAVMHWTRSGDLIVMVVLGGMGTLFGPVAGATLFLLMEKFIPDFTEHWKLIFGPAIVLIVLFAKHGLIGWAAPKGTQREGH
ncbi:MAG: branched-chain amino acid ABC transporter permease [Alphaproteobacteria bacterium]|nr:branched-chain amino acid ABC transporter permease [Alphaproteobacteria bacterium]